MSQPVPIEECFRDLIDPEWVKAIDDTPFLVRCRNGNVTRRELRDFVVQHYYYSRNFTRFLCALLSNMSDEDDRLELTENLLEEIGSGSPENLPHSKIYQNMMKAMRFSTEGVGVAASTQTLIDQMYGACRNPNPIVGLAALCLGAEAVVPHIYSQVVTGFQSVGEKEKNLEFFTLHIACDDKHAITMKALIEKEVRQRPHSLKILTTTAHRILSHRREFFLGIAGPVPAVAYTERSAHVQLQGLH